jgi:hypothetical protein
MYHHLTASTPQAGVDPIVDPASALRIIHLARHDPPVDETIVLLLDAERRGRCITVVTGTWFPDDVVEVTERIAEVGSGADASGVVAGRGPAAIVVASCRPGTGLLDGDIDRWLDMSDIARGHGIELVEWFVVGDGVHCPRDRFGEPPRW